MKYENLGETTSVKTVSETGTEGVFEIEGLYSGYGVTVGNALRRVLLSSLPGAAITQAKIKGASHEFGTLDGVAEDIVEIILNLKRVRFQMHTSEPQVLLLRVKGERAITGADMVTNSDVEVITPDAHIATITDKGTEFEMEVTIEKGLGYVASETRKAEKLPIGVIALDAIFSPVIKVHFSVENMRIGDRTDYNKLRIAIVTDGSMTPSQALSQSGVILQDYFAKLTDLEVQEVTQGSSKAQKVTEITKKKVAKKTKTKNKEEK